MEVTIKMNTLTLNTSSIRNKFFALIIAFLVLVGVTAPQEAHAVGGVDDLNVSFSGGKANIGGGKFDNYEDSDSVWDQILTRFHTQIAAVFGIFMLVALFKFGQLLTKLIMSSDNPRERGETITGLIIAGIATAGLGSATILFGFFYHLLL